MTKRGAYRGIPILDIDENRKYDACLENKMTRSSHNRTPGVHTSRIMELLHMDLFGPTQIESKVVRTPVPTTERISKDPKGKKVEQTLWLHIVGEVRLLVNHCLLGLPGVRKEELKRVLSHPQVSADNTVGAAQDNSDNVTRFLILAREPMIPRTDRLHKAIISF
nr:arogenate dehydratase/prephenate dehydratase 1, chloroplastic [Ipomoea batatas]